MPPTPDGERRLQPFRLTPDEERRIEQFIQDFATPRTTTAAQELMRNYMTMGSQGRVLVLRSAIEPSRIRLYTARSRIENWTCPHGCPAQPCTHPPPRPFNDWQNSQFVHFARLCEAIPEAERNSEPYLELTAVLNEAREFGEDYTRRWGSRSPTSYAAKVSPERPQPEKPVERPPYSVYLDNVWAALENE
jgi:hypothetical protein